MKPVLTDWLEWKERCARKLCTEDTQNRLGGFAQSRFGIQLNRQISNTNLHNSDAMRQLPSADDAWHQFESFAVLKETKEGKRYKDWIFMRTRLINTNPLDIIQSGATLIIRSVVRAYLKAEYSPKKSISMEQPLGDGNLTVGDLLPGSVNPIDAVAENEYDSLSKRYSEKLFSSLSYRERIGLLAKFSGIALDNKEVLLCAGCGKSRLNQITHDILKKLGTDLQREYHDDGPDTIKAFTIMVIEHLEKELLKWKFSEKNLPSCFY